MFLNWRIERSASGAVVLVAGMPVPIFWDCTPGYQNDGTGGKSTHSVLAF